MALKLDKKLKNGIVVENAYARVEHISSNKHTLGIHVKFYTSVENESFETLCYQASFNIEGENPFIQAYEYLKTLDEFADAEDC